MFFTESVKFNTTAYCGGRLQVNYEDDKWEDVCPWDTTPGLQDMLNKLCQAMNCGDHNISITDSEKEEKKVTLNFCWLVCAINVSLIRSFTRAVVVFVI